MDRDYQNPNIFEADYACRIQTFEQYLENPLASQEHYAHYKAGLMPSIFYGHNLEAVLERLRKEFDEILAGLDRYEDSRNDLPMLKSFANTERGLRKVLDTSQLQDYANLLEWSFGHQRSDAKAAAVSRFFLRTAILDSYIFHVEKIYGKGILD